MGCPSVNKEGRVREETWGGGKKARGICPKYVRGRGCRWGGAGGAGMGSKGP